MDIKTLLFVQAYALLIVTLFFFAVYRLQFPVRGPGWWVSGFGLLTIGLLLLALRGVIPDALSIAVAHILIFVNYILLWKGFLVYLGRPGFSRVHVIPLTVLFLIHVVGIVLFGLIHDSMQGRSIIFNGVYSAFCLGIAWTLLQAVPQSRSIWMTGWIFLLNGIVFGGSMLMNFTLSPEQAVNWLFHPFHIGMTLFNIGIIILYALVMLLLISDALNSRISRQKDDLERNLLFREEVESLLAHDIMHPLIPVIHLPDKIIPFMSDREEAGPMLRQIKTAGVRIRDMIHQRLEMFQMEQGRYCLAPKEMDMNALLHKAAGDVSIQTGRHFAAVRITGDQMDAPYPSPVPFQGDPSLIYVMAVNLLANAVEASPEGDEVRVSVVHDPEQIILRFTNKGEFPQDIRSRFARKYATSGKPRGRGLGLYSARLAVKAHGGDLTLDDGIAGWTTIQVCLPLTVPGMMG